MKTLNRIFTISLLIFICFPQHLEAQKYRSNSYTIHFYSSAPVEDIEATNLDGQSALDISTNEIVFSIPIKSFTFEKSLMQEHFNENYLESDKYPKSTFRGNILGLDVTKKSWQDVKVKGMLSIHGVENDISYEGKIIIEDGTVKIESKFQIKLVDYKIKIPKVVFYNIAEIIDVTVKFEYEKTE